jgi:hypothetical protein
MAHNNYRGQDGSRQEVSENKTGLLHIGCRFQERKRIKQMTRHQRRKKAIHLKTSLRIYAEIAIALHEQFGFGQKRISRVFQALNNESKTINNKELEKVINECKKFKIDILHHAK